MTAGQRVNDSASPGGDRDAEVVIRVDDLRKTFRAPFTRRRVEAVRGISLSVRRGEVFGFLGPNGAGKTTTIRILMGLIAATGGRAEMFGHPVPSRTARARMGFLPESPYFYSYLTVAEMLDLTGRLCGMSRAARKRRAGELIERVGLAHAATMPMVKYSKGMLQRAGIAQALIHEPDLIVLDEPMSGLDPVGRKEVIDIIVGLRARGVTVFFSSHILNDVEVVCDRVAILDKGRVQTMGDLAGLLGDARGADVAVALPAAGADVTGLRALAERVDTGGPSPTTATARLAADADIDAFVRAVHAIGARVLSVVPRRLSLEQLFIQTVGKAQEAASQADSANSDSANSDSANSDSDDSAGDAGDSAVDGDTEAGGTNT